MHSWTYLGGDLQKTNTKKEKLNRQLEREYSMSNQLDSSGCQHSTLP